MNVHKKLDWIDSVTLEVGMNCESGAVAVFYAVRLLEHETDHEQDGATEFWIKYVCGLSPKIIRRCLKDLRHAGLVCRVVNEAGETVYRVTPTVRRMLWGDL